MKLYRFNGKAEAFRDCGMLFMDPMIGTSESELRKRANKWMAYMRGEGLAYKTRLERLEIDLSQTKVLRAFEEQIIDELLVKSETLKEWEYERTPDEESVGTGSEAQLPC